MEDSGRLDIHLNESLKEKIQNARADRTSHRGKIVSMTWKELKKWNLKTMQIPKSDFEKFPKIPRLNRNIIITEKIDGTNAQIYVSDEPITMRIELPRGADTLVRRRTGRIWAGSRNRWIIPEHDNFGFAAWVREHADELLQLGPGRHFGEWWGQGINRGYGLNHRRFSLFNVSRWGPHLPDPIPDFENSTRTEVPACCHVVPVLWHGLFRIDRINDVMDILRQYGSMAAPGFMNPEGIVIYHTAGNCLFKVTLENDDKPKGGK